MRLKKYLRIEPYLMSALFFLTMFTRIAYSKNTPVAQKKAPQPLVQKISKAGNLKTYPNANTILIDMKTTYNYNLDGTYISTMYGLRKILTQQGKKDYSEKKFGYYRKYDKIYVKKARVIKSDGTILNVPKENITDITPSALAAMNIYEPDQRQKVINFPNLEVGDAIEYFVVDTCYHAVMDSTFDTMYFFREFDPILHDELSITGPSSMPLRYKSHNDPEKKIQFSKVERNGKITYKWWVNNQPKIIREPAMAPFQNIAPGIWASTIPSWRDISRWGYHLNEKYIDMNDALRNETHQLVKNCKTRDDSLKALYHFVAQKVRYMGIGLGKKTGFDPKPATKTYETKYGVCRDVAVLLVAMLREVGIPAYVVYTAAGYKQYPEIPNLVWSHAITAVPKKGGGYIYIDPTVENGMNLLMSVEANQETLVLTAKGDSLSRTPYSPPEDNMGHIKATTELKENGSAISHIHISSNGIYDLALRQVVKAMPPAQLKNIFQNVVSSIFPGAKVTEVKTGDPADLYTPLTLDISFESKDFALKAGKYLLIKSPLSTGVFDLLGNYFLKSASLPKRHYPFNLQTTLATLNEETLILPVGYRVKAVPNSVNVKYKPVEYRMAYKKMKVSEPQGKPAVQYKSRLAMKKKIYSPEEYLLLKKVLKKSQQSKRGYIILEKIG